MNESANEIVIGMPVTLTGSMSDRNSDSKQVDYQLSKSLPLPSITELCKFHQAVLSLWLKSLVYLISSCSGLHPGEKMP